MPTVLRVGPYRFFFYAGDYREPAHIHVQRGNQIAKFWLNPVRLHNSVGFRRNEINEIERIIEEQQQKLLDSWHDFFTNK